MLRTLPKSTMHDAAVPQADLHYVGSVIAEVMTCSSR